MQPINPPTNPPTNPPVERYGQGEGATSPSSTRGGESSRPGSGGGEGSGDSEATSPSSAGEGEGGSGESGGEEGGEFEPVTPEGSYQTGSEITDLLQPPEPGDGSDVKELVANAGLEVQAVDWVFQHIAGKSLVETVIKPLTGDSSKMRQNAEAWENISNAMKQFSATMSSNAKIATGDGWSGPSALAHRAYVDVGWKAGLFVEGEIAKLIAKGFNLVADQSEKLAEKALELLKKLVDKLIEIAAKACVPVVGWAAEATTVIDAIEIANQIYQIIEMIKDIIENVKQMWQSIQDVGSQLAKIKDIHGLGDAIDIAKNIKGDISDISEGAKTAAEDAGEIRKTASEIGHGGEEEGDESSGSHSAPNDHSGRTTERTTEHGPSHSGTTEHSPSHTGPHHGR